MIDICDKKFKDGKGIIVIENFNKFLFKFLFVWYNL